MDRSSKTIKFALIGSAAASLVIIGSAYYFGPFDSEEPEQVLSGEGDWSDQDQSQVQGQAQGQGQTQNHGRMGGGVFIAPRIGGFGGGGGGGGGVVTSPSARGGFGSTGSFGSGGVGA